MSFIILDLEATCWQYRIDISDREIIEIGAVKLDPQSLATVDVFARFVRPVVNPVLSSYCLSLTSISQDKIDNAKSFDLVFVDFLDWIGNQSAILCSWGRYDIRQLQCDCRRHHIQIPEIMNRHINLKREFANVHGTRPCGMERALARLGLPLIGIHHRGIDDARNIAAIARRILPRISHPATASLTVDH